jgi:hypothetical protein
MERRVTLLDAIPHDFQQTVQSSHTYWSNQKETLFVTTNLSGKNLKHFLSLAKRDPVHTPLYGEEGEEDILRGRDAKIVAQQLKSPHKGIRVRMDLGRRQFGPAKHLSVKIGKGEPKTHVSEDNFIYRKDMVPILRTHSV